MAKLALQYIHSFYDSRGKLRHTFRRRGKSQTIKGHVGSANFMQRYHQLLEETGGANVIAEAGRGRAVAGSVDMVIETYYKSDSFKIELAKTTQVARRTALERFRAFKMPSGRTYGMQHLAHVQRKNIEAFLIDMLPNVQRSALKALRHLFAYARAKQHVTLDPCDGIKPTKAPTSTGHMTWGDEQIAQYRKHHAVGTVARLALELALNIAARRHDLHEIGRQHLKAGHLTWTPSKTLRKSAKTLTVRLLPEFTEALAAMQPKKKMAGALTPDTLAFMVTKHGGAYGHPSAFGHVFAQWVREAGLKPVLCDDGRVRTYSLHGLRKAACTALAHAGCTGPEIMAVSGHSSLQQVQIYIDSVNQQLLANAAMDKRSAVAPLQVIALTTDAASR
jgi:integrase/recombinase XerD